MESKDFDAFYNSLIADEKRDIVPHIEDTTLSKERKRILDNLYLKEVCRFVFTEGKLEFGAGVAEALVQYLAKGELRLCNVEQWLYSSSKHLNEQWLYANLYKDTNVDKQFFMSSIGSFFSDVISRIGEQHLNGIPSTLMDFNVMLHIFIMKTKAMKCNTDLWNGVDLSSCKDRSPYTKKAFDIFRFQYNQQVVNDMKVFIRMTLNSLAELDVGVDNISALGLIDHVALDVLGQNYRFDNGYNTVEPDVEELDKISRKILRIYERRTSERIRHVKRVSSPKLKVYLCSADSYQYLIAKQIAMYFGVAFFEVYNVLKHITNWDDDEKLASKIARIIVKFDKESTYESRLSIASRAIELSREQRKVGIIDEDFYFMCSQYYIPNMEFVVYNWNMNVFEDLSSEVEIDFKNVLERAGRDFENYLVHLYHAGQNINILRRLVIDDDKFFRVTIKNVPFKYSRQVECILQRETRSVNSKYGSRFCYLYTLDNSEALEIAKTNMKNGGNAERDAYLEQYKGTGIRLHKRGKYRLIYPSGAKHRMANYFYRKSDWRMQIKGRSVTGRRRIIKGLDVLQSYFELKRKIEDEKDD